MIRLTNDLSGFERVVEHHDVADVRVAEPIGQLVDDQAVLVLQRRRHALALDARDLEAERDDQRGVDGGRGERLEPGDQLFAETVQPRRRSSSARLASGGGAAAMAAAGSPPGTIGSGAAHRRRRGCFVNRSGSGIW